MTGEMKSKSIFLLAVIVCVSGNVFAYSGGAGTSGSPYQIANVTDFQQLSNTPTDCNKYFILTADINLDGLTFTQAPIAPDTNDSDGFQGVQFTGRFDGNDHTISNLTIDESGKDYIGLFGQSAGYIRKLGVVNVDITGHDYVGGLVGFNRGTITSCYVAGEVYGHNIVGGLTGWNKGGSVSKSYADCTVDGRKWTGGCIGYGDESGSASACYALGIVRGTDNVGGFIGTNGASESYASASSCYASSRVSGQEFIGGFAGTNHSGGSIMNCYASGNASGTAEIGGFVGYDYGYITKCYSAGRPSGGSFAGGFCGVRQTSSTFVGNFWDMQTSGKSEGAGFSYGPVSGATGKTTEKMKEQETFTDAGWDFVGETANGTSDIWTINESVSYPKLTSVVNEGNDPELENLLAIAKCTVTAGKKENSDKISFSGTMNAGTADFNNVVKVTVDSNDMNSPLVQTFPINGKTFKKGKYSYSRTVSGVKKSFAYNTASGKFSFSAGNVNLSGLDCPINVEIEIGDYIGIDDVNEAIVNGARTPVPALLMMGVKNILRVDKCTVKQNSGKPNSDQLSVKGGFAVADVNVDMTSSAFVVTLGAQTFTLPAGSFIENKNGFVCSKEVVTEGGIANITFNFNLCSFVITIKGVNIPAISGDVDLGVAFTGFDETEQVALQ